MRSFYLLFILALFELAACQTRQEKTTTVFLLRHAEKDTTSQIDDPPLTAQGRARAARLWAALDVDTIQALYSTDYQRTRATLAPIAEKLHQSLLIYQAHDFDELAREIRDKHAGETVLISAHSNTILPIIQALGGQAPVNRIEEDEYGYIFKVDMGAHESPKVSVIEY